jgi:hypothetical protein
MTKAIHSGADRVSILSAKKAAETEKYTNAVTSSVRQTSSAVADLAAIPAVLGSKEAEKILNRSLNVYQATEGIDQGMARATESLENIGSLQDLTTMQQADALEPRTQPVTRGKQTAKKKKKKSNSSKSNFYNRRSQKPMKARKRK